MVLSRISHKHETMPQTVPSAGFTPPSDYSTAFAADCFDLSLLPSPAATPNDAELPSSHATHVCNPSTPSMFHASNNNDIKYFDSKSPNFYESTKSFDNLKPPPIFTSYYPNSPLDSKDELFEDFSKANSLYSPYGSPLISHFKEEPIYSYQSFPIQSPISPPSSCTSYSNHSSPIYPQSVSPMNTIKSESSIDITETLKEVKLLQKSYDSDFKILQEIATQFPIDEFCNTPAGIPTNKIPPKETRENTDHQLLREVLRDTSFQKKFNLLPFDFGNIASGFVGSIKMEETDGMNRSLCGDNNETEDDDQKEDVLMSTCNDELAREKIDPVLSLAFEHMQKEVNNTCSVLGISTDPTLWSSEDVKAWLLWTLQQFNLAPIQMEYFNMDGQTLAELTDSDFIQRAPEIGGLLHAQLEIWKAACYEITRVSVQSPVGNPVSVTSSIATSPVPATINQINQQQWVKPNSNQSSTTSSGDISEDDEEDISTPSTSTTNSGPGKATSSRGPSGGGSHIHLWQFLKELLASPTLYGSAIRWLDRGKGVFKIEDSVRVARLWGKRKNRPAMNYDKLSRSIRQYYKKGIMKKTERSQRLVYQFCHPYCL